MRSNKSEIERISELFQRVYGSSSWYGPSLRDLLSDLSTEEAATRPLPEAHTIWELVRHIVAWQDFVTRMLHGDETPDPEGEENWPPVVSIPVTRCFTASFITSSTTPVRSRC